MERFIQLTSAPAQKIGPVPVRTTARTASSFARSPKTLVSSAMSLSSNAFRTSGRSSATVATGPERERARLVMAEFLDL